MIRARRSASVGAQGDVAAFEMFGIALGGSGACRRLCGVNHACHRVAEVGTEEDAEGRCAGADERELGLEV